MCVQYQLFDLATCTVYPDEDTQPAVDVAGEVDLDNVTKHQSTTSQEDATAAAGRLLATLFEGVGSV